MTLQGHHFIGKTPAGATGATFHATNPSTGERLSPPFAEATADDADRALRLAAGAAERYRALDFEARAAFLERAADEIMELGDALLTRAGEESGLPAARLTGERGRTVGQIRMFAEVVREGSWVEARIDHALPDREPLPKPDVRRMLIPIGPVVVFGASNFPLAFSVAGGDTASALAAGCPVVVKGHPAHPGTCELVAGAILKAAEATGMPDGVFSLVHGSGHEIGLELVRHADTRAVAFTGSLRGGRALFDAAASRPDPIPVYAEMGSINPVFVLPGALEKQGDRCAEGLIGSVTLGVGQFCTNPGLVVGCDSLAMERFTQKLAAVVGEAPPGTMLHDGIRQAFEDGSGRLRNTTGVRVVGESAVRPDQGRTQAAAVVFGTDAGTFLGDPGLSEEVFGPSTLVVQCASRSELEAVARGLQGHLTATIHGTADDLKEYRSLVAILETKVGRLLLGGFPTGVEVCPSMQHGGPYPATTDSRSTSVGTAAISRFARPLCYQSFPGEALPVELRDRNERGILRLVDGVYTRE